MNMLCSICELLNRSSFFSLCVFVRVSQRVAAERRGHPPTPPPTGDEEEGVSESCGGEGDQTERAASGIREDRRCQQDVAQEVAGTGIFKAVLLRDTGVMKLLDVAHFDAQRL